MVKPSLESALKEAYASCLPFHLIQHALGLEYNAYKCTCARICEHAYAGIYAHRASVTGIAPVRDSFVPRALSLSARFICTRIDISPVRVRIRPWSPSLTLSFLPLSFSFSRNFFHFLSHLVDLTARSFVRYAFSAYEECVPNKEAEERGSFYLTSCNYFMWQL